MKSVLDRIKPHLSDDRRILATRAFYVFLVCTIIHWFVLPLWIDSTTASGAYNTIIGLSYDWFAASLSALIIAYEGFAGQ